MTNTSIIGNLFHDRLREASGSLFWLGLAMVVLGIAALVFPMISTLAATIFVGWIFLLSGSLTFIGSFSIHGTGPFFGALLFSLLSIAAGVFLLFNPLAGAVALTLLLGVTFVFQGASEIAFAFEMRPLPGWGGVLISGIASIVMAVLIAAGWPEISVFVLGILLGVNFLTTGLAYLFVSRVLKPAA
jgi:uncharacterized membrane protein HdeD (DUF308 family)